MPTDRRAMVEFARELTRSALAPNRNPATAEQRQQLEAAGLPAPATPDEWDSLAGLVGIPLVESRTMTTAKIVNAATFWAKARALTAAPAMQPAAEPGPAVEVPEYLFGWDDILAFLFPSERNPKRHKETVARLNEKRSGPIITGKRGEKPRAARSKLAAWWQSLESEQLEAAERRVSRRATANVRHDYGRNGVVLPEIGGEAKGRRRPR